MEIEDGLAHQADLERENEKILPSPGLLLMFNIPPFFCRNSLHSIRPKPVPASLAVPGVVK
jgi:hypothetical protein